MYAYDHECSLHSGITTNAQGVPWSWKLGKSWNLVRQFSRLGKSVEKLWKMKTIHRVYGAPSSALIFIQLSNSQPTIRNHAIRASVSRDVPVYSPSFCWVLNLPTHGGWLRLSRPGCRGGLAVLRWSPIQALTRPDVE